MVVWTDLQWTMRTHALHRHFMQLFIPKGQEITLIAYRTYDGFFYG